MANLYQRPGSFLWDLDPFALPVRRLTMYVCHCNVVTDSDVLESIANGAQCVADVARQTGAGRTCGNCISSLRDLVCQHCPVRAERNAERELGVADAAR